MISGKLATLEQLSTVYGVEDMYGLVDVIATDLHNQRLMNEHQQRKT